jgi:hypothetical protein
VHRTRYLSRSISNNCFLDGADIIKAVKSAPNGISSPASEHASPIEVKLLGGASIAVLGIILCLGLWPFHSPRNQVSWIKNADGLAFKRYGTVFSLGSISATNSDDFARRSVEAWVRPEPWHSFSFLSFYDPDESLTLSMRQSDVDFELTGFVLNSGREPEQAKLYVDKAFHRRAAVFVAVTSGAEGIGVYLNGVLARRAPGLRIVRGAFEGRLILGDAPINPDGWRGDIRGVAVYNTTLSNAQIVTHYRSWKNTGRPNVTDAERIAALYLMREGAGNTVHDETRPGTDLVIPRDYTVIDKIALEPIWKEFEVSSSYARAAMKNIVGFMPLGFCFYGFLVACQWKRPLLATILSGFFVSLTIEVLQAFLPTRDSGTTDLVTNTLGTWTGAEICRFSDISRLLRYLRGTHAVS